MVFGDLTEGQRQAAMAIFETAMSREGYEKITGIMEGDETLAGEEGGGGSQFGIAHFAIAIFGTPSATDAWMVQHDIARRLSRSEILHEE